MNTSNKLTMQGLTSDEAKIRLHKYGMNQLPEEHPHLIRLFILKFWGPIPWMLEVTMALQIALIKIPDAAVIFLLLVVNAVIGYSFERKARHSLALLQQQLEVQARVLRDGEWKQIEAQTLVPGDVIRLRIGDIVPADANLIEGYIAVDQSSLTGETDLVELQTGSTAYTASVIRRGGALAEITATGIHTSYSKTARLIQIARPEDHGDTFVQHIVLYLMAFTGILVLIVLICGLSIQFNFGMLLLFALALLIAAIPVSLPTTFTLTSAVGARQLARHHVLATHLAAIKEAGSMDILCADKTGTITRNELTIVGAKTYNEYSRSKLLRLAALASDEAAHDPIDAAIIHAAHKAKPRYRKARRLEFTPFDPQTKRTEAVIRRKSEAKRDLRVIKGAPQIVSNLTQQDIDLNPVVEQWASEGRRCIAIAAGKDGKSLKTAGLLALQDPLRDDAVDVVSSLQELGVRVVMVTGDDLPTARTVAATVGIKGEVCSAETLKADVTSAATRYDVFARVYPEDKYKLVHALQSAGHIVGMTGDGVNDAPAIRQAEIGIAMNNATDITKQAADLILTQPGLKGLLTAIEVGRRSFQRITTYTLNKVIKTFHLGLFLSIGLLLTGQLAVQPMQILLMVLANDLASMALTSDQVHPSQKPDRWLVAPLLLSGFGLAMGWLVFSFAAYYVGRHMLALDDGQLNTFTFVMLALVAQANVYLIRERRAFWRSIPSRWLLCASGIGLSLVVILAVGGILMTPIHLSLVVGLLGATSICMLALDGIKQLLFRRFGLQ